jgi:hypothetical protein
VRLSRPSFLGSLSAATDSLGSKQEGSHLSLFLHDTDVWSVEQQIAWPAGRWAEHGGAWGARRCPPKWRARRVMVNRNPPEREDLRALAAVQMRPEVDVLRRLLGWRGGAGAEGRSDEAADRSDEATGKFGEVSLKSNQQVAGSNPAVGSIRFSFEISELGPENPGRARRRDRPPDGSLAATGADVLELVTISGTQLRGDA